MSIPGGSADFDAMAAEVGLPMSLTFDGERQEGYAVLDARDEELFQMADGRAVSGRVVAIMVRKNSWRGLVDGAEVEIQSDAGDWTTYRVVGVRAVEDGETLRALLAEK